MRRRMLLALALAVAVHLAGCGTGNLSRTVSTSPDVAFVYDPGLGVYAVEAAPGLYYSGGYYYRYHGGGWERSSHPQGAWKSCPRHRLPPGLRKQMG